MRLAFVVMRISLDYVESCVRLRLELYDLKMTRAPACKDHTANITQRVCQHNNTIHFSLSLSHSPPFQH